MSQSSRLRLSDLRAVILLVGECRELGDDPHQWRDHLAGGVAELTCAGVAISAEIPNGDVALRRATGEVSIGWDRGFDQTGYVRLQAAFVERSAAFIPHYGPYTAIRERDEGVALTRADLISDRAWYRSEYYRDFHQPLGGDAILYCYRPIPADPAALNGFILVRATGKADFSPHQKALVHELNAAIAPLIGGPLARFGEPCPTELPPRTRAVLRCVLEGDGDKQIAARLGLRPLTVNQHTKLIYQHFNVRSRAELLARWVRRGWGARFAWTD
jgi:DNA-binding CsgD family transcriptional regulator